MVSVSEFKNILIVANSGRMLAQCVQKAGFGPVVVDCFSDSDTQAIALRCIKVETLALESLTSAVSLLINKYQLTHVIYGSGLELYQDSLVFLQNNLIVIGNDADTFAAVQDKEKFFFNLQRLAIPYPEVSFNQIDTEGNGLIKPMLGEGGIGIKKSKGFSELPKSCYWQQYIIGIPMSVLFVANGVKFKIYGYHKQWVIENESNEYIFSGLISQPEISNELKQQLSLWIAALVNEYSLKGINSLDFILSGDGCFVLEVNARPSASMQLYRKNLISEHINSVLLQTFEPDSIQGCYSGYKIIFAETALFISNKIEWPSWVTDRPVNGSIIHTGLPICSMIARGNSEQHVLDILQTKQQLIKKLLQ